jgi:flagellar basal-body rod protein FlgG
MDNFTGVEFLALCLLYFKVRINHQEGDLKNLWVPLSGAISQQRNVETIANNVANANTPGFKKDQLVFKEHLTVLNKGYGDIDLPHKEWKPDDFYRSYGAEHAHVKIDGNYTNFQQGQLSPTGNLLDVGLQGPGFIEVLTPNGIRFTRRGILTINPEGLLVTDQGNPVLKKLKIPEVKEGEEQPPLAQPQDRLIKVTPGRISINIQGEMFADNNSLGQLSVVEFKDSHALRKEGNSLFVNKHLENLKPELAKTTIHQGFVEQSNVNAIKEMSDLIKANRQFESIQKVIKAYDNIAGKSVNDISRF